MSEQDYRRIDTPLEIHSRDGNADRLIHGLDQPLLW